MEEEKEVAIKTVVTTKAKKIKNQTEQTSSIVSKLPM